MNMTVKELAGKKAYEDNRKTTPQYHDGTKRPEWRHLSVIAQQSWIKKRGAR